MGIVLNLLAAKQFPKESRHYDTSLNWLALFPGETLLRRRLIEAICKAFSVTEAEIILKMEGKNGHQVGVEVPSNGLPPLQNPEDHLLSILPKRGWLEHYTKWTAFNEAPLSYHLATSLVVLGTAVGRKCWIDMGHFKIFPNISCILIGPTGIVHKSAAIDIGKDLVKEMILAPIMGDKVTAEAFASALVKDGHQFLGASEFSVFFGRQRYNEGLTTLIIRLLDCPSEFEVNTQTRGVELIVAPTLSIIGGSTMSLLSNSTPEEVLSSGFLNRFQLVIERDTDRVFTIPRVGPEDSIRYLKHVLSRIKNYEGAIGFSPPAFSMMDQWYRQRKALFKQEGEMYAEISARNHGHLMRVALLVHLAEHGLSDICLECMQFAVNWLTYIFARIPSLIKAVDKTPASAGSDYVLRTLRNLGGAADHSTTLRRVANKMNATQLKQVIQTLEESGLIKIVQRGSAKYYILEEQKDAHS